MHGLGGVAFQDIASPLKECMMAMPSLTSLPLSGAEDELLSVPFDSDSSISTERLGRLCELQLVTRSAHAGLEM